MLGVRVWKVGNVEVETVNLNLKQFEVPPGLDVALSHVGRKRQVEEVLAD